MSELVKKPDTRKSTIIPLYANAAVAECMAQSAVPQYRNRRCLQQKISTAPNNREYRFAVAVPTKAREAEERRHCEERINTLCSRTGDLV